MSFFQNLLSKHGSKSSITIGTVEFVFPSGRFDESSSIILKKQDLSGHVETIEGFTSLGEFWCLLGNYMLFWFGIIYYTGCSESAFRERLMSIFGLDTKLDWIKSTVDLDGITSQRPRIDLCLNKETEQPWVYAYNFPMVRQYYYAAACYALVYRYIQKVYPDGNQYLALGIMRMLKQYNSTFPLSRFGDDCSAANLATDDVFEAIMKEAQKKL